jgi:hypothetical protein
VLKDFDFKLESGAELVGYKPLITLHMDRVVRVAVKEI